MPTSTSDVTYIAIETSIKPEGTSTVTYIAIETSISPLSNIQPKISVNIAG